VGFGPDTDRGLGALWLQTLTSGEIVMPFGPRRACFGPDHFRLGPIPVAVDAEGSVQALTLRLPLQALRRHPDLSRVIGDAAMIQRVRFELSDTLRSTLWRFHPRRWTGHPQQVSDPERIHALLAVLAVTVTAALERLARLPGRSLFKRVDLFMRLEAARDHIARHFDQDPSTPFLADIAHVSRAHFIRLFSEFYGVSPKQMTLQRKLEEASRLMRESRLSVAEVAALAGFGNRCAFQRLFKERMGCTPLQFRQRADLHRRLGIAALRLGHPSSIRLDASAGC